ncbi:hypothetical protein HAX54_048238 [Datura stramonium]|uniref:Uncharacterized protein n=1 Tax=Datura stramonium TaxID=4076 RepID=A0ABS8WJ15_DATST|nr:hypothetical protein [Datura stramonium]
MAVSKLFLVLVLAFMVLITLEEANGAITGKTRKLIDMANRKGPCRLNAGVTTQLLLALFKIKGVVHCNCCRKCKPISSYWRCCNSSVLGTYCSLDWQKYSLYLALPRKDNIFLGPVDPLYFAIAKKLEGLKLEGCLNATTCLSHTPKVAKEYTGTSASIYLDNAAYRSFIYNKFDVSPVEMESAAIALLLPAEGTLYRDPCPFRHGWRRHCRVNGAATFTALAATNSVEVVVQFIKQLPLKKYQDV